MFLLILDNGNYNTCPWVRDGHSGIRYP